MSVIVWLLIPLAAVIVAMVWTAALARRERRRADEQWRAQRMAELGSVLAGTSVARGAPTPTEAPPEAPEADVVADHASTDVPADHVHAPGDQLSHAPGAVDAHERTAE